MPLTIFESFEFKKVEKPEGLVSKYNTILEAIRRNAYMDLKEIYSSNMKGLFFHVILSIAIPSRGVFGGLDIRSKEEILIFCHDNYPYKSPSVLFVRDDFPTERIPHLNSGVPDTSIKRMNPCLYRGDMDEWFWQNGPDMFCDRVNKWFSDLVNGELIKNDGFEVRRQENSTGIVEADFDHLKQSIDDFKKDSGFLFLAAHEKNGKYYKILNHVYTETNIKEIPCIFVFDRENIADNYNSAPIENGKDMKIFPCMSQVERGIRRFRAKYYNPNQEMDQILLIMAVKRPSQVIGSFSEYEYISFIVHYDFVSVPDISICQIDEMITIASVSNKMIERLAGTENIRKGVLNILGCGALGSNIAMNLFRLGYTNQRLYDNDILLPHNLIRHFENNSECVGISKSRLLAYEMQRLLDKEIEFHQDDILQVERFEEGIIVDSTASKRICYWLMQNQQIKNRVLRSEIYMGGKLGISLLEGEQRNPDLIDLQVELYKKALDDQIVYDWLHYAEENSMQFHIGVGCSSDTMVIDAATISNHASVVPHLLKNYIDQKSGIMCLNIFDNEDLTNNRTKVFRASEMYIEMVDEWEIHIQSEIFKKVSDYLQDDKENAGLWIGVIDEKLNRIIIVDTFIPQDNIRKINHVTVGQNGVQEYLNDIAIKSNGILQYVGEWHTHTAGNASPSSTDLQTFSKTEISSSAFLMTIFAPLKIRHWILQEKEGVIYSNGNI